MKTKIMINGLPGNMAKIVAEHAFLNSAFDIIPFSLSSEKNAGKKYLINNSLSVKLIPPQKHLKTLIQLKKTEKFFIIIDFAVPSSVNINGKAYCKAKIPFVMGTTGGDVELLEKDILKASIPAVIAPNMARQVVAFQAMLEFAVDSFPDLFKGYSLKAVESHQSQKVGTSGTAEVVVECFKKLGALFSDNDFYMERDPQKQLKEWKIPNEHLGGHGWHTYTLNSDDSNVKFEFTHNVCGRNTYIAGAFDAIFYLANKTLSGCKGKVFSMIDVLKK
ncbi:MAG: dihydrodipicolinate reductase [Deltaproteobacteria bacterium]|nr:dihydrodipicolinate reductase [Deltaproteobacteria bacterium]